MQEMCGLKVLQKGLERTAGGGDWGGAKAPPGLDQGSDTYNPPVCESVGLSTEPALLGLGGEFPDPVWAHDEPSSLSSGDG